MFLIIEVQQATVNLLELGSQKVWQVALNKSVKSTALEKPDDAKLERLAAAWEAEYKTTLANKPAKSNLG